MTQRPTRFFMLAGAAMAANFVIMQFVARSENGWLKGIGLGTLAMAIVLIAAPFFTLPKYGRTEPGDSFYETTQVVDRGVYALVRHPQYLGYALLNVGLSALNLSWTTAVLAILAFLFFYLQSVQEEKFCHQQMGAAYATYCQRVPRFNLLLGLFRTLSRKLAA